MPQRPSTYANVGNLYHKHCAAHPGEGTEIKQAPGRGACGSTRCLLWHHWCVCEWAWVRCFECQLAGHTTGGGRHGRGRGRRRRRGRRGRRRRGGGPRPHPRRRGDRLCRGRCRLCSSRPGGWAPTLSQPARGLTLLLLQRAPGLGRPLGWAGRRPPQAHPAAGAWARRGLRRKERKRRTADARRRRGHRCGGASYCSCGARLRELSLGRTLPLQLPRGQLWGARLGAPATAAAGATTGASAGADSAAAADAGAITGAKLGAAAGAAAGALTGAVTGANPTAAAAAGAVAAAGAGAAAAASGAAAGAAAGAVAALTAGA